MKRKPATLLLMSTLLAVVAGGCTDGGRASLRTPDRQALDSFTAHVRLFRFDYEPAGTPSDLARQADVVVTGTIVDVRAGQSYAPTAQSRAVFATSVLEVKVDRLLSGDRSLITDGAVYVEIAHPAFVGTGDPGPDGEGGGPRVPFDVAGFAATVPRAHGVFFLEDRTNEPYWEAILGEGQGRPAGAAITAPFVQGFLVEGEGGEFISVLEPFELMPPAWHRLGSVDDVRAELV